MNYAITGSTGFIGVHLIHHLLRQGHKVIGLKRPASTLSHFDLISASYRLEASKFMNLTWVDVELSDVPSICEILEDVDVLVHCAALISYNRVDRDEVIRVNSTGTAHIVNACLKSQTSMILMSSTSAIGKDPSVGYLTEETLWDESFSYSNYGLSKHLAELEFWRGIEEGLKGFILNPGVVLGYGNWNRGSLEIFKKAWEEFPFYSSGISGFTGVHDLCEILIRLVKMDIAAQRILVINENRSYGEVLYLIADAFQKKRAKWNLGGGVLKLISAFVFVKELLRMRGLISKETVDAATSEFRFSGERLLNLCGYEFQGLEQVIGDACKWYKKSPPK